MAPHGWPCASYPYFPLKTVPLFPWESLHLSFCFFYHEIWWSLAATPFRGGKSIEKSKRRLLFQSLFAEALLETLPNLLFMSAVPVDSRKKSKNTNIFVLCHCVCCGIFTYSNEFDRPWQRLEPMEKDASQNTETHSQRCTSRCFTLNPLGSMKSTYKNRNDSWSPAAESRHDSTACVSLPRRTCNRSPLKDVSSSIFFRFKSSYNHLIQQVFRFFLDFITPAVTQVSFQKETHKN